MKIAFETDGIFLLDLITALWEIGYEKGPQYRVIGKVGSAHHIEFKPDCAAGLTPVSFAAAISLRMPGTWHMKVRPLH
ncbi:hypothetical protein [Agrobacterium tumefaciens]|uniref:hypothetical protein n=1 Tax=Agrobacterium tumefaciens TaxID=358 RepID=UPI000DD91AEF|nr:hypothetical protein [Agrobacterium tumefaciens]